MILFPHLRGSRIVLTPVPFRAGAEVHQQFADRDVAGLDHPDVFTELYCSRELYELAMQFEVRTADEDASVVGCSTLIHLDPHAGHVRAGVFVLPGAEHAPAAEEARLLTANYAFATWNVRKVYSWHVHGEQLWPEPLAVAEGTLREYLHDGHRYLDMDVLALYRTAWDDYGATRVEQMTAGAGGTARRGT